MKQKRRRFCTVFWITLLLLWLVAMQLGPGPARAGAHNPCLEPGNLTYNCGFDRFVDHYQGEKRIQIPEGWWFFILDGSPDFRPADDTYWGAPSLWLLTDGVPFTAGVYQEVDVTPGVVYQADAGWAAATVDNFERKLGLDPTGGTDPLAPSVIWGPAEWGINAWPDLTVSARATGPKMTLFVWVSHQQTYGNDWFFLDAVGLWPDPNQPAATLTPTAKPTSTPRPPTRTPTSVPPTATPTATPPSPTPTATPVPSEMALDVQIDEAQPAPTETPAPPTPTLTPTLTPSPRPPTATPTPSSTPTRTAVPVARLARTPAARAVVAAGRAADPAPDPSALFLYVALGALAVAVLLGALLAGLWLRGRRAATRQE